MIKVIGNNYYTFTEGIEIQKETKEGFAAAFSELVQKQRQEYAEKIKNGTTEPSYQIGAGSYTKKEWDKLLESFDKAEEAFRKELEEEKAKEEQKRIRKIPFQIMSVQIYFVQIIFPVLVHQNLVKQKIYI